jgi:hypothetical protein
MPRLALLIRYQNIYCDMFYEMGKHCSDKFVSEAPISSLFADMLCELGMQCENRRREMFIDSLVMRRDANHSAHRTRVNPHPFKGEGWRRLCAYLGIFIYGITRYWIEYHPVLFPRATVTPI